MKNLNQLIPRLTLIGAVLGLTAQVAVAAGRGASAPASGSLDLSLPVEEKTSKWDRMDGYSAPEGGLPGLVSAEMPKNTELPYGAGYEARQQRIRIQSRDGFQTGIGFGGYGEPSGSASLGGSAGSGRSAGSGGRGGRRGR